LQVRRIATCAYVYLQQTTPTTLDVNVSIVILRVKYVLQVVCWNWKREMGVFGWIVHEIVRRAIYLILMAQ